MPRLAGCDATTGSPTSAPDGAGTATDRDVLVPSVKLGPVGNGVPPPPPPPPPLEPGVPVPDSDHSPNPLLSFDALTCTS